MSWHTFFMSIPASEIALALVFVSLIFRKEFES
jgi:hypothetical protein